MTKRSLILYASMTGNTEKVALRFKKVFEKKGWECDIFKIDKKTDVDHPPFDLEKYDFLCIGSPVIIGQPVEEILKLMFRNPLSGHHGQPTREEIARMALRHNDPEYMPHPKRPPQDAKPAGMIVPGPKKGVVCQLRWDTSGPERGRTGSLYIRG
jgi:multimeric flavodoxin WrbA